MQPPAKVKGGRGDFYGGRGSVGAITHTFPPEGGREINFLLLSEGRRAHTCFPQEQDRAQAGVCRSHPGGVLCSSNRMCVPGCTRGDLSKRE